MGGDEVGGVRRGQVMGRIKFSSRGFRVSARDGVSLLGRDCYLIKERRGDPEGGWDPPDTEGEKQFRQPTKSWGAAVRAGRRNRGLALY